MTSVQDPDKELVQRIQNGDRPAFNQLVLKYRNRVMGIAARMLGDRGEAEELAQDVFVKVYRALGDFRGASLFSTWLFRVTANSCLNHRRRRRAELRISDGAAGLELAVADPSSNPHHLLEQKELRTALEKSIRSLPEEQRIVLILRDVEGLSYEAIADSLELEPGTVRSRLHRARLQVQASIRERLSLESRGSERL